MTSQPCPFQQLFSKSFSIDVDVLEELDQQESFGMNLKIGENLVLARIMTSQGYILYSTFRPCDCLRYAKYRERKALFNTKL